MLNEFKSRATASVIMTQGVAETILGIIGKAPGPQGVILPEQMSTALAALDAAVRNERATVDPAKALPDQAPASEPVISLAQRVFPFNDMLRRSLAANKEITWGV